MILNDIDQTINEDLKQYFGVGVVPYTSQPPSIKYGSHVLFSEKSC